VKRWFVPPVVGSIQSGVPTVEVVSAADYDVVVAELATAQAALRAVDDFYWPPDPDIPGESEIVAEVHALVAGSASGKDPVIQGDKQ
jgi:hypothetical protein